MAVQKLRSKNQIVTLLMPKPKRYARTLQGLAKGTYPPGYLKREHRSW